MTKAVANDIRSVTILKGLSITGVLFLHGLSSLHHVYGLGMSLPTIILDQFLRFCVPLFVALSGYALASKYGESLDIISFFRRRVLKLVPAYILWSIIFVIFIDRDYSLLTFVQRLLHGTADYHLYFVPMIFVLYLLFPILRFFMRRFSNLTLFILLGVQLISYIILSPRFVGTLIESKMLIDQNQYVYFFNWIGYFGLGMWFGFGSLIRRSRIMTPFFFLCLLAGLGLAVLDAGVSLSYIYAIDPLIALRTTRLPIYLFALGVIGTSFLFKQKLLKAGGKSLGVFEWLGAQSYVIYLSHTILFRMIFALYYGEATLVSLLPLTLVYILGLFLSRYL